MVLWFHTRVDSHAHLYQSFLPFTNFRYLVFFINNEHCYYDNDRDYCTVIVIYNDVIYDIHVIYSDCWFGNDCERTRSKTVFCTVVPTTSNTETV